MDEVISMPGDRKTREPIHHVVKSHTGNFELLWATVLKSTIRINDREGGYLSGDIITFREVIPPFFPADVMEYTSRSITGRIWLVQAAEEMHGLKIGYVQIHFLETGRIHKEGK